jgi:hypothetical protein
LRFPHNIYGDLSALALAIGWEERHPCFLGAAQVEIIENHL